MAVPACSDWLNSTWRMVFKGTLVALGNGLTACAPAAVFAGDPATVNCPLKLLRATSFARCDVKFSKTGIRSPGLNELAGVNSIACALLNNCTAPVTGTPLSVTYRAPVTVEGFIAALVKILEE